ncbi:MAG: ATP-dependent helicase, partial [Thermoplasmataceae archaeon]
MDNTIVIANPGTGKTQALAEASIQLLNEGVSPEDMILTTFTNKAAEEMKLRLTKLSSDHSGLRLMALRIPVGTVHSHVYRALEDSGYDFKIIDQVDLRFLIWKFLKDRKIFSYETEYLTGSIVPKMENAFRYLKSFGIVPNQIRTERAREILRASFSTSRVNSVSLEEEEALFDAYLEAFRYYEDYKAKNKLMDYNDILLKFLEIRNLTPKKFVLVDEFQDLNELQVRVIDRLGKTKFLVGDRKQSIFGFQGGSLKWFRKYAEDRYFHRSYLKQNRRSTNNIIKFSTTYLLNSSEEKDLETELQNFENPHKGDGEPVKIVETEDPESVAASLAYDLANVDGYKKIGIIARTNGQLAEIARALDEYGVQYSTTLRGTANKFALSSILNYLRGLFSSDLESVIAALFTPFSGMTLKQAAEISKESKDIASLEAASGKSLFWELRNSGLGVETFRKAMDQAVIPISVSLGKDYVDAATAIMKSIEKYADTHVVTDPEDMVNYCRLFVEEEVELEE